MEVNKEQPPPKSPEMAADRETTQMHPVMRLHSVRDICAWAALGQ